MDRDSYLHPFKVKNKPRHMIRSKEKYLRGSISRVGCCLPLVGSNTNSV